MTLGSAALASRAIAGKNFVAQVLCAALSVPVLITSTIDFKEYLNSATHLFYNNGIISLTNSEYLYSYTTPLYATIITIYTERIDSRTNPILVYGQLGYKYMYATTNDLLKRYDIREIAEAASRRDKATLSSIPELIWKVANGESTIGYDSSQLDSAIFAVSKINLFLEDASKVVDSYISGITITPVFPIPDLFVKLVCDIAYYELVRPEKDSFYANSIKLLSKFADGSLELPFNTSDNMIITNSPKSYFSGIMV